MPHSPYLNLNRDLDTLERIVRDHEASKPAARASAAPSAKAEASDIVWEPVYPKPVALAS